MWTHTTEVESLEHMRIEDKSRRSNRQKMHVTKGEKGGKGDYPDITEKEFPQT